MSALPPLDGLPRDADGPVFAEPWQAQAFAMVVALHQKGAFTWPEWAQALSRQFGDAAARGEPDTGSDYYDHWLAALERLIVAKSATTADDLQALAQAWDRAAKATPHGKPIELGNDPQAG